MRANPYVKRAMKTSPHFVCGVNQPGPSFAGLCGTGRSALSSLPTLLNLNLASNFHMKKISLNKKGMDKKILESFFKYVFKFSLLGGIFLNSKINFLNEILIFEFYFEFQFLEIQ